MGGVAVIVATELGQTDTLPPLAGAAGLGFTVTNTLPQVGDQHCVVLSCERILYVPLEVAK